ncbi:MAG: hypothetical protein AAF387_09155 [Pseudomonadota bacterium]
MMKKLLTSSALAVVLASQQAGATDTAVINFTATLMPGGYSGVAALDPFQAGTVTNNLVNGLVAGAPASQDWLKFDAQVVISNFSGDGTYEIGGADAGGIYFQSPLLNRIEAVSIRSEGALQQDTIDLGVGRRDGNPTQNRDDFYLPDFDPNGIATITINGTSVSVDYALDFSTLPITNAEFLRNGDTSTQISDTLAANNAVFSFIGASGTGTATPVVQANDGTSNTPYGSYTSLSPDVGGNLSNTLVPLTLEALNIEIAAGNITSDGRLVSDLTTPTEEFDGGNNGYLPGNLPFFDAAGDVTFYDLTGQTFEASVSVVPVPAAVYLLAPAFGMLMARRRKAVS